MNKLEERHRIAKERIRQLRKDATIHEKIFLRLLVESGIPFIFQKAFISNTYFMIADFYLPTLGVVIELDGHQHYIGEGLMRDAQRKIWLESKGISVVHYKNREVLKMSVNGVRMSLGLKPLSDKKERKERVKKYFKKEKKKVGDDLVLSF